MRRWKRRALAQRSASAAREIKSLISSSVEKVESGASIVREAGDTIRVIVDNAQRISLLLGEISTGASEQSSGLAMVGRSAQELDTVTQQNTALVQQTAAASSRLKDSAVELSQRVARFKLPASL